MEAKIDDYRQLISATRQRDSTVSEKRSIDQESESDRGRVIFSSPLRRLQQKAQVYSLEDNAAVRSRLTHSLEVAQTGRWIGQLILAKLRKRDQKKLALDDRNIAFLNFIETSCLIHDLGNPPFGHLGEFSIQDWFKKKSRSCLISACKALFEANGFDEKNLLVQNSQFDIGIKDFTNFDGNCQGLRIVCRLQWKSDEHGLNLTYSQLLSYLKYVVHAHGATGKEGAKKKGGYFLSEEPIVNRAWQILGMKPHTRHPLAYIMEAADDIAYSISDIEDAIEKGLIRLEDFLEYLESETVGLKSRKKTATAIRKSITAARKQSVAPNCFCAYTDLRTSLTRILARFAAEKFVENHSGFLNGTAPSIFDENDRDSCLESSLIFAIKSFAFSKIYPSPAASNNELAGYAVLHGLLDHHLPLLSCRRETFEKLCSPRSELGDKAFKPNKLQQRLFDRLPGKYRRNYLEEVRLLPKDTTEGAIEEWFCRAHLITDYISGMTDDFALETFQLLSGIQVGKPI